MAQPAFNQQKSPQQNGSQTFGPPSLYFFCLSPPCCPRICAINIFETKQAITLAAKSAAGCPKNVNSLRDLIQNVTGTHKGNKKLNVIDCHSANSERGSEVEPILKRVLWTACR